VGGAAACANAGVLRCRQYYLEFRSGFGVVIRIVSGVLDPVRSESTVPGSRMYLGSA